MAFLKYGACTEAEMPFNRKFDPAVQPSGPVQEKARALADLPFRWRHITRPGVPDRQVVLEAKRVLAEGSPILAGSPHSLLVVGYFDDPRRAGGGYFIVRDSGAAGGTGAYITENTGDSLHSAIDYARVKSYGFSWIEVMTPN